MFQNSDKVCGNNKIKSFLICSNFSLRVFVRLLYNLTVLFIGGRQRIAKSKSEKNTCE